MTLLENLSLTKEIITLHQQVIDIKANIIDVYTSKKYEDCKEMAQAEAKFQLLRILYNKIEFAVHTLCNEPKTGPVDVYSEAELKSLLNSLLKDLQFVENLFNTRNNAILRMRSKPLHHNDYTFLKNNTIARNEFNLAPISEDVEDTTDFNL